MRAVFGIVSLLMVACSPAPSGEAVPTPVGSATVAVEATATVAPAPVEPTQTAVPESR